MGIRNIIEKKLEEREKNIKQREEEERRRSEEYYNEIKRKQKAAKEELKRLKEIEAAKKDIDSVKKFRETRTNSDSDIEFNIDGTFDKVFSLDVGDSFSGKKRGKNGRY